MSLVAIAVLVFVCEGSSLQCYAVGAECKINLLVSARSVVNEEFNGSSEENSIKGRNRKTGCISGRLNGGRLIRPLVTVAAAGVRQLQGQLSNTTPARLEGPV